MSLGNRDCLGFGQSGCDLRGAVPVESISALSRASSISAGMIVKGTAAARRTAARDGLAEARMNLTLSNPAARATG